MNSMRFSSTMSICNNMMMLPALVPQGNIQKDNLSEILNLKEFSQMSEVGSDDYRYEMIHNEHYIDDF